MGLELTDGVAVLRMDGGKANAFSAAFLDLLDGLFDELAASDARSAVLIGYERFFSAGLALPELIALDRDGMRHFIARFSETMLRIFTLELPLVAAVNGHAIAGGCVLAIQADRRVMSEGKFKIGLNEVQLGIALPTAVIETLRCVVPAPSLLPIAQQGLLFSPEQALALGLVDELVAPDALESRAVALAAELGAVPPLAFAQVKRGVRRHALARIDQWAVHDREAWLDTWYSDEGRARLEAAVAKLK